MKIRTRLCLAFLLLAGLGFYRLVDWILDDLRPRYLETMEESMVDTATLLSSLLATQMTDSEIKTGDLRTAFGDAQKRVFAARIYQVTKTNLSLRVYITDRTGTVVFDSDHGRDEGRDYSQWNDVARTLRDEYGARTTRTDPEDPTTAILYVASPIEIDGNVVGVVTVGKPSASVRLFLHAARKKVALAGIVAGLAVVLLGVISSFWITHPIRKLTAHARAVKDGSRSPAPKLGGGEIAELGTAFEEMRDALEGRQYVEHYVQALTHEMKGPLSGIRGAAELLQEEMSADDRKWFLSNIQTETARIQEMVDRMLQLSSLEGRKALRNVEEVDLSVLARETVTSMQAFFGARRLKVAARAAGGSCVKGERFLIRQALSNLLRNAAEFSPEGAEIAVALRRGEQEVRMVVSDSGPGIPEYALPKVFDRFYSLQRPDTGKKSSGLGLTFVKEVAELHGGTVRVENRDEGGVKATLVLPEEPSARKV